MPQENILMNTIAFSAQDGEEGQNIANNFETYRLSSTLRPLFFLGSALNVLKALPSESVDFCMTSPPYWGKREYQGGGIGLEKSWHVYLASLIEIFAEIHRTLKSAGSFWLNMGDSYENKGLLGLPWRLALEMIDSQGWILRNEIIWNKIKGSPDNSSDKLRNLHEPIFHFVKRKNQYYFNVDAIRANPQTTKVVNGAIITATGVSGVRYRRQIELSTSLTREEKKNALAALEKMLNLVRRHELSDFRMIIRGQQRATHSDSVKVSGRARELKEKGFYFLKYDPNGSKPGDVWDILPEDSQTRDNHFAPYPEDLCKIPLLATCPEDGIALDPFCGTGTTNFAAMQLGRKSVGIDISGDYISIAEKRCWTLL